MGRSGGVQYIRKELPNGVRLILVPMDGVNSVATSVMVHVGSRFETKANNGISHFLEHMVFKGTNTYPTTDDVNVIERAGGIQNAYTDIDVTNYHNKVLSTDWELALEINKELALAPRLEQNHVDRERDVILEEMKRYEDEPAAKVSETFHSLMYPGTKLGMRTIGEEAPLRATAAAELRAYHDTWYTPERIVVVVAGKIATGGMRQVTRKTEEWFGGLEGKSPEYTEKVKDLQEKPRVAVVTKPDAQQAHLTLGLRLFPRASEHRFAWSVFNLLMGVSFTSRLFREIREKRGLCYHISSSADTWDDVGYWSIYAGVATEKVTEAIRAIIAELAKVRDHGVTEEEVAVSKKRLKTILAFKSEDPEFLNSFYGKQELYHEPILTLDEYLGKINGITAEDINKLLPVYLRQEHLNLALVWQKPEDRRLSALLRL
ncbi:insulinase family protein [Patescibacteria group bacterium]|nr:insulinase family protein [Patescibacteria group bacterium]